MGDIGLVPKNILTSYWCGYLLGGIKEVKDFLPVLLLNAQNVFWGKQH